MSLLKITLLGTFIYLLPVKLVIFPPSESRQIGKLQIKVGIFFKGTIHVQQFNFSIKQFKLKQFNNSPPA